MPSLGIFCSSSQRVYREKIMQTAVVDTATTQTKVCKRCGVEKPLSEFYIVNRRWHLRVCKACTLGKMKGYHLRTWSERYRKYQEVRKQRTRRFYMVGRHRRTRTNDIERGGKNVRGRLDMRRAKMSEPRDENISCSCEPRSLPCMEGSASAAVRLSTRC